jgi:hypothetical protein
LVWTLLQRSGVLVANFPIRRLHRQVDLVPIGKLQMEFTPSL